MRIFKITRKSLAKKLVKLMLIFFVFGIGLLMPQQIFAIEELQVQCNLNGQLNDIQNKELVFVFSDDMMPLGGSYNTSPWIAIVPGVAGEFLWRGTKTLVFKPAQRFAYSTRYSVLLKKGMPAINGKVLTEDKKWEFSTPLAYPKQIKYEKTIVNIWPKSSINQFPIVRRFSLIFAQPLEKKNIRSCLEVFAENSKESIPFSIKIKKNNEVRVKLKKKLRRDGQYKIIFKKGVIGREGNQATDQEFMLELTTPHSLKYIGQENFEFTTDEHTLFLPFTVPLHAKQKKCVAVFKNTDKEFMPYKNIQWRAENNILKIFFPGSLPVGAEFKIHVSTKLKSADKGLLNLPLEVKIKFCSPGPAIYYETVNDKVNLHTTGIRSLESTLIAYKNEITDAVWKKEGDLFQPADPYNSFADNVIKKEINWKLPEPNLQQLDLTAVFKKKDGFFSWQLGKIAAFNGCRDQAIDKFCQTYTSPLRFFSLNTIDFIMVPGADRRLFLVFNNQNGKTEAGASIAILRNNEKIELGISDKQGMFFSDREIKPDDTLLVKTEKGESVFAKLKEEDRYNKLASERIVCQLFTERDYYLPGETVYIAGVVKKIVKNKVLNSALSEIRLEVHDPNDRLVFQQKVKVDLFGGFHAMFKTPNDGEKGSYRAITRIAEQELPEGSVEGRTHFTVDYFPLDRIKVEIKNLEGAFHKDQKIAAEIWGRFLSGIPMANDDVSGEIEFYGAAYRLSFLNEDLDNYCFELEESFQNEIAEKPSEFEGRFDAQGRYPLQLDMRPFARLNYIAEFRLSFTGESKEGKEFSQDRNFVYFPGERAVGIKYLEDMVIGEQCIIDLVMVDAKGKTASGKSDITIYQKFKGKDNKEKFKKIAEFKDAMINGSFSLPFKPAAAGEFLIKCDASDGNGNLVSTSQKFRVHDFYKTDRLNIKEDYNFYKAGEQAAIKIRSPYPGKALVVVAKESILDTFVIDLKELTEFSLPLKDEYARIVKIYVIALYENGKSDWDDLYIYIENDRSLQVELTPIKNEIRPSSLAQVKLKISAGQKKGIKAHAFVYAVDEGNLQLSGYETPDLTYLRNQADNYDAMHIYASAENKLLGIDSDFLVPDFGSAIGGVVLDAEGQPLAGVEVTLTNGNGEYIKSAVTGEPGYYLLARVPAPAGYILHFNKDGYEMKSSSEYFPKTCSFRRMDITLSKTISKNASKTRTKIVKAKIDKRDELPAAITIEQIRMFSLKGIVILPDGSEIPGVTVTLFQDNAAGEKTKGSSFSAVTNENGVYAFRNIPIGSWQVRFELDGFKTRSQEVQITKSGTELNMVMETATIDEAITVSAKATEYGEGDQGSVNIDWSQWANHLRQDFQSVLFFKQVETDDQGNAVIEFKTSDQLSTYRIMAVAYNDDQFGATETEIAVSKELFLEEAMPEFARSGDHFQAGVQVGNRTDDNVNVLVAAQSHDLKILDLPEKRLLLAPRNSDLVQFNFSAPVSGECEIKFLAQSKDDRDALLKKITVSEPLVFESLVDFDMGSQLSKKVGPLPEALMSKLKIKVAPSILKPGIKIAEKLLFFPYECLEQRTAKVMPYLVLDDDFIKRLQLPLDQKQIHEAIDAFIKIVPEFKNESGGLSYYRGSDWSSDYLTLFVLWSLKQAQSRNFSVDEDFIDDLEQYLSGKKLGNNEAAFYQFILSLDGEADAKALEENYKERNQLSLWGRVFLFRTMKKQSGPSEKVLTMEREFINSLQVEADFAYFDAKEFSYLRDIPFYSSRYVTALILQALLEVNGSFELAPRIMKWLLEADTYAWNTTHTNFWILYAMNGYAKTIEKNWATKAEAQFAENKETKAFKDHLDVWQLEKAIPDPNKEFSFNIQADQKIYLTTELQYTLAGAGEKSRGIRVQRNVYDEKGREAKRFIKGQVYQVELLLDCDKEVPYGVIDEPLAAGFELIRQDIATSRSLDEFNREHAKDYGYDWTRQEHSPDRQVYYSYWLNGKVRLVYFIKALYAGEFTWLPTIASGMYHPQYFGRGKRSKIVVEEK